MYCKNPLTEEEGFEEMGLTEPVNFPEGVIPVLKEGELYPSQEATDFYHHFKEDIALMAEMGFKAFRMSISWSRISQRAMKRKPMRKGCSFYDQVFDELLKYGIEPLVTLSHYEIPLNLAVKYNHNTDKNELIGYPQYDNLKETNYADGIRGKASLI